MGVTKGAHWPAEVTTLSGRVAELEELTAALAKRLQRLEARVRKVEKPTESE